MSQWVCMGKGATCSLGSAHPHTLSSPSKNSPYFPSAWIPQGFCPKCPWIVSIFLGRR